MRVILEKNGKKISLIIILVAMGLIGLWMVTAPTNPAGANNTILIRSTGGLAPVISTETRLAEILTAAKIQLNPGDRYYVDGQEFKPDQTLPAAKKRTIQIVPASKLILSQNGKQKVVFSSAPTLGQALWENGIRLTTTDRVSPSVDTYLAGDLQVTIEAARTVTVQDGDKQIQIHTAAGSVGEALAENGFPLTALDETDPAPDKPLPVGKPIQILRNSEEMVLTGKDIEFKNENVVKEDMDQGGSEIVQTGENGFEVSRERVLITNGKETSRIKEGSSVIKDPVKQITNVGSKAVVRSVDTGPESLDYYRVEEVYATSYSPCRQGYPDCRKSTASGTPLAKGVIAVTPKWYKIFGGTHIYIPGYGVGTVADTGGGIPGKYWIDLGYGEEDFVNWHQTVTIYFLNPAPANVPEVLP
jgi:uncharacterized protein YabE (DUF348 family)